MDKKPTAGIILAAGLSTRFGGLKQLLKAGGSTILSMVVDAAVSSDLDGVVLVLGHKADTIKASIGDRLLNKRLKTFINDRFQEGMSTSLQCGLKEVEHDFPSIMVLMGDQPLLSNEFINRMLQEFRLSDKDICVPVYKGERGLPVCFTKRFYNDIFFIKGDKGARDIIRENPDDILHIHMDVPNFLLDIDNNDDYERLKLFLRERS